MQQALATDLLELSTFFGGATALPAAAPAKTSQPLPQPPPPKPIPPPAPQPVPPQAYLSPPVPTQAPEEALPQGVQHFERNGQVVTRRKAQKEPSRHLSPEEKDRIRADWNSLPENLRNPTNRAAIAAKYQCSRAQVFALTRTDLHQHLMSANAARVRKQEERQAARQG